MRGNTSDAYLRARIKGVCGSRPPHRGFIWGPAELAKGGCLSCYEWNGGGEWTGKPWTSELPTDAQVSPHALGHPSSTEPLAPLTDCGAPVLHLHGRADP